MGNTWWYILYNFSLWLISYFLVFSIWKKNKYSITNISNKKQYNSVFFTFLLFSLFTFYGGDKDGYREMVEGGYKDAAYYEFYNMESFYVSLADFVGESFLLWKLVVYGVAIFITYITIKRLKIENYSTLIAFVFFLLISYGSTRAVLAYSIFLFGFTFLDGRLYYKILGYAIIFSSLIFHGSMILPICLSILCEIRLTKKRIILLIISFPFAVYLFNIIIDFVVNSTNFLTTYSGNKFDTYANSEEIVSGSGSLLMKVYTLLNYFTFIPLLYWSLKAEVKQMLPSVLSKIVRVSFLIVYCSFLIRFSNLPNTYIIFTRYFTMMPFFLYVSFPYILNLRITTKQLIHIYPYIPLCRNILFFLMSMYYESFK